MKLQIETNVRGYVKANQSTLGRLAILCTLVLMFIGAAALYGAYQPLIRDFVVANVAHIKAGPSIPWAQEEIDGYTRGFKLDPNSMYSYGIESNSAWVAGYTRLIVPYMSYEKATGVGVYPRSAGVIPFQDKDSFHVGGRMFPSRGAVVLNERYFLDQKWNDKRSALSTLVHELVHVQGGAYLRGTSAELETATVTATTEILAAMCNYGDPLACSAFWHDIEGLARSSLLVQLDDMGLRWVYDAYAELAWRDQPTQDAYLKSMRYWAEDPGALMELRRKYSLGPWTNVVFGVAYQIPLDTGHIVCQSIEFYSCGSPKVFNCSVLGMPFDDARYLLQGLIWVMK